VRVFARHLDANRGVLHGVEVHDMLDVDRDLQLPAQPPHRIVDREPTMELPSVPLLFYSIPSHLPLLVKVKILVQAVAVDVDCTDLVVGRECVIVENPQLKRLVLRESDVQRETERGAGRQLMPPVLMIIARFPPVSMLLAFAL
jgi:hypothetical protein